MARRTSVAAAAKLPSTRPMLEADKPFAWPTTGTTKLWASQHEDIATFTINRLRRPRSFSRSQAGRGLAPVASGAGACRGTRSATAQAASGSRVDSTSAALKPARSMTMPVITGASALDSAGPSATQLNTRLSCEGSRAIRPASRWIATAETATAPPQSRQPSASSHNQPSSCAANASTAPAKAIATPMPTGRWKPWRSASRPAHIDSPSGATANRLSSTPTKPPP